MLKAVVPVVVQGIRQVQRDDIAGLSAELAYRFFMALFPFAIFVTSLGGAVARALRIENPAGQLTNMLQGLMPQQAVELLAGEFQRIVEQNDAALLSISALSALFFATGATRSVIKGMNRALEVQETRPFVARYALAIGLTLFVGLAAVVSVILLVAGQLVGGEVAGRLGLEGSFWTFVSIVRWPLLILLLAAIVIVLYRYGPNARVSMASIVPSALAFAVVWVVSVIVFGAYVGRLSSYGATYGALAGVAILLIWLYISAFILLGGVELTAVVTKLRRQLAAEGQAPEAHEAGTDSTAADAEAPGSDTTAAST